jgi:transposase
MSDHGCLRWARRCAWHPHRSPTGGLRRGIEDKTKLGRHRWVVERTLSWLLRFKRLGLRYDRTEATLRPLLLLAVSIINLRRLVQRES